MQPANSDYIQIRSPVYLPHTAGRYAAKRFRKSQCPIVERLTNSIMMNGRNNGKKLMAVRIVAHSFEIVRDTCGECAPTRKNKNWRKY
jgi:small subunit ribosomal protein S5e